MFGLFHPCSLTLEFICCGVEIHFQFFTLLDKVSEGVFLDESYWLAYTIYLSTF